MDHKLVSGFYSFLSDALVSWITKIQATVSTSSFEAKYKSTAAVVTEILWTFLCFTRSASVSFIEV